MERILNHFRIQDERIKKETDYINLKAYAILQITCLVTILIKAIFLKVTLLNIAVELFALIGCNSYIIIRSIMIGVNPLELLKGKDECLLSIKNEVISQLFYVSFYMVVFSGLIYLWGLNKIYIAAINFLIFLIPGIYATYYYLKYGLLILQKRNKEFSKTRFKVRLSLCSLGYGVIVSLPYNTSPILSFNFLIKGVLLSAVLWGVPMYIILSLMIKRSKKNADKRAS